MHCRESRHLLGICLLAWVLSAGCAAPAAPQASAPAPAAAATGEPAKLSNTDPCAMRMHDLCGGLLLYFAQHQDLPSKLEDLATIPGLDAPGGAAFVCPESAKPYVYSIDGMMEPERRSRIILYDPEPSHLNMRWAIRIQEPQAGEALVARVVALPESRFMLRPPR